MSARCPYDVRHVRTMSVRCPVVCPWYVRGMSSASGHTKRPPLPTPEHARSSEDAPFGPASSNGVFAGRVVGRILLPRRRSCLVGAWRDADFAIIAITTKTRQSAVPLRTNLVKFVGVAGAGSESGLPPSFSTAVACVRARLESLEVQRGRTKVAPDTAPDPIFITIIRCGWFCTVGPPRKHSPCC